MRGRRSPAMNKPQSESACDQSRANVVPFKERPTCTVAEACVATGIGRTKLYELIRLDQVTAKKIGRRTLIVVSTMLTAVGA
jgi:excisionase family DNA binding protein